MSINFIEYLPFPYSVYLLTAISTNIIIYIHESKIKFNTKAQKYSIDKQESQYITQKYYTCIGCYSQISHYEKINELCTEQCALCKFCFVQIKDRNYTRCINCNKEYSQKDLDLDLFSMQIVTEFDYFQRSNGTMYRQSANLQISPSNPINNQLTSLRQPVYRTQIINQVIKTQLCQYDRTYYDLGSFTSYCNNNCACDNCYQFMIENGCIEDDKCVFCRSKLLKLSQVSKSIRIYPIKCQYIKNGNKIIFQANQLDISYV